MQEAFDELHAHLTAAGSDGDPFAASLAVSHRGKPVDRWTTGRLGPSPQSPKVGLNTKFLVASATKPVTATAVMCLVEEKAIDLSTRVHSVLPGFAGEGKEEIQVLHLLTHTSGLPDMVSDNIVLRERHAGLAEFFRSVCRAPLCFRPGSQVGYQSMGSLVLAQLVERLTDQSFERFLAERVLDPIGMRETCLGFADDDDGRTAALVNLPPGQTGTNWHWNSRYWRTLGAPWGGLLSTATDLAAFAHLFVNGGRTESGKQVISEATCIAMCQDWTGPMKPGFPPLGLGWFIRGDRLSADRSSPRKGVPGGDQTGVVTAMDIVFDREFFGASFSPVAVGHAGVTGCAMWSDPRSGVAAALLTNSPAVLSDGAMTRAANLIARSRIVSGEI